MLNASEIEYVNHLLHHCQLVTIGEDVITARHANGHENTSGREGIRDLDIDTASRKAHAVSVNLRDAEQSATPEA